jgi:hypothetical protein
MKDISDFYPVKLYPSSKCIECERSRAKGVAKKRHADPKKKPLIVKKRKLRESIPSVRESIRQKDKSKYARRRETDPEGLSAERARYFQENKFHINTRREARIRATPELRLRKFVSGGIYNALRSVGSSKRGQSVMKFMPYSLVQLRAHIENHHDFESWMNWGNWGSYNKKIRTWQIDHIIPQCLLPFDDMNHPNFLKCWGLSNLQPLEARKNLFKGAKLESNLECYK